MIVPEKKSFRLAFCWLHIFFYFYAKKKTAMLKYYSKPKTFLLVASILFMHVLTAQPTISSFSPTSGTVGTTVIITGTNFNATPANNIVYFGAAKAVVSAASTTSLTVAVPVGATYKPITVTTNNLTAYTTKPFMITFSGAGTSLLASSFAAKIDSIVGVYPISLGQGDFDGDGKVDIAVARQGSNTVAVMRNISSIGNIAFASKQDYTTGTGGGECIYISDVDGDGKLDMITVNPNAATTAGSVSVFRNTSSVGNISFAGKVDFPGEPRLISLALADLNSDGKPDLVTVTNSNTNSVSIYKNTSSVGNISFAPRENISMPNLPGNIDIGDLDGDSKPDLAIACLTFNGQLFIFRNTSSPLGAITFSSATVFASGTQPASVAIGDLNNDGKLDISLGSQFEFKVYVFGNLSTVGNISFSPKIDVPYAATGWWITLGDVDGDGKLDIATANIDESTTSLLKNSSTTGIISFMPFIKYTTATGSSCISICDFDGDGKPDLASANYYSNTVSFLRNRIGEVVPLNLLSLTGQHTNNQTLLQWQTANETNTANFSIEHSIDGTSFSSIGNVSASGNSNSIKNYSFTHTNPKIGTNYYRLKMMDVDGKFTYSPTVAVRLNNKQTELLIHPNPAKDFVIIEHPNIDHPAQIKLLDMTGKIIQTITIKQNTSQTICNVRRLSVGSYQVIWFDRTEKQVQQLIIQ